MGQSSYRGAQVSAMDIHKLLAELREELDSLNAAIASVEQLERPGAWEKRRRIRVATRPTVRRDGAQAVTGTLKAK